MAMKLYELAAADPSVRFSPYCWRVRLALAHKGLGVETIPWRYHEKSEIAFSGQDKVPVLVDGTQSVSDSWDIAVYLDEKYPERPLFAAGKRGEAFFLKQWTERVLQLAIMRLVLMDIFYLIDPKDKEYFRQTREQRFGMTLEEFVADREGHLANLRKVLEPLRGTLEKYYFLAGARPDFSDYIVFGAFQWAKTVSTLPLVEPGDPILAWFERLRAIYRDQFSI